MPYPSCEPERRGHRCLYIIGHPGDLAQAAMSSGVRARRRVGIAPILQAQLDHGGTMVQSATRAGVRVRRALRQSKQQETRHDSGSPNRSIARASG